MNEKLPSVLIFTDGSCAPSRLSSAGGWAAVLCWKDVQKELSGFESDTTNNRMEVMGAIRGLEALKKPCAVTLYSDSAYLVETMRGRFRMKKNKDLWERLIAAAKPHRVEWLWIRGHDGNPLNERADTLAVLARRLGMRAA